jgi:hemoglobin/transferrin/lactoferrin receptor protein
MNCKRLTEIFSLSLLLLLLVCSSADAQTPRAGVAALSGSVLDPKGDAVIGAVVRVMRAAPIVDRVATTGPDGRYRVDALTLGTYTVTAEAQGFQTGSTTVNVAGEKVTANITLGTVTLTGEVTVSAARGETEAAFNVPENVSVVGERELRERRAVILPQLLEGEPGVAVQQSTSSQGSPYVRGLTGQQVVNLIDGVRFNNSTFRPGPNQYTALIEPADVGRIEIVRGPNAVQYGSDSFGGTINIFTAQPAPFADKTNWHGGLDLFFGSADLSTAFSGFASVATKRTSLVFGGAAHQAQDLRAGGGRDSRAAVTRFLGLDSRLLGSRLQDTKFQQYSGFGKFIWTPTTTSLLTLNYLHSEQHDVRRYDQLNGGVGNLINSFDPQVLDFFYARYEKADLGFLDSVSATFSSNGQRDDRTYQGGFGDPRAVVTDETNRTNAFGYSLQGTTHIGRRQSLVFGAEVYDEYVRSHSTETDPVTGVSLGVRARYPNGARYTSFGTFVQDSVEVLPGRLRLVGGLRYSLFNYRQSAAQNPFTTNGLPSVPDSQIRFDDVTFNVGAVVQATDWLAFNGIVSRGFRAPNVSDFGSIGLTSLGFEVTPEAANAAGAKFNALSPETTYNYEVGAKIKTNRIDGSFKFFDSEINGLIERKDLILPSRAVGKSLGGQLITFQNDEGEVFTALSTRPIQVRQNTEAVRLRGFEASLRARLSRSLLLTANTAYVRNNIKGTDEPAEFEGFAPPFISFLSLRWEPLGRNFWIEGYSTLARRQSRYSEEDFEEQRTGAARSRNDITAFFNNGALARGLVGPGADGRFGTADNQLLATGETLAQVQNRVLPVGAVINGVLVEDNSTDVPLYLSTAGFATLNLRAGYRFSERHTLIFGLENILDKNYRINGSGIDSPGINATVRYSFRY